MNYTLAGDVGGTNTRLALFEPDRKDASVVRVYASAADATLEGLGRRFLDEARSEIGGAVSVDRGCVGVAGPVDGDVCRATNLPWTVDGRRLREQLSIPRLRIVNDFFAMARSVPELEPADIRSIGGGEATPGGPIAVLGPGTGLGYAFLIWSRAESRYRVVPSEGSHADFAPRTPAESRLLRHLSNLYGRVSAERALCGPGLVDIATFLDGEDEYHGRMTDGIRAALSTDDAPAAITDAAVNGDDPVCHAALSMFAEMLGAVAGNLALMVLARGGVVIGGGIAPRLVDFLADSGMRDAFEDKGRFRDMMRSIPLSVITRDEPALLGAAAHASEL